MNTATKELTLYDVFTTNIREQRLALGLTQRQLAAAIGIPQPNYASIESGQREPGFDIVAKIAKGLGCEPGDLFREKVAQVA
jgi:transcriptional regulator with XRE-family HTH domain